MIDLKNKSLEDLQDAMDFNGYSWFDLKAYKNRGTEPCFIPENADSVDDVESWESMNSEVLSVVKTKEFLLSICENYDNEVVLCEVENSQNEFSDEDFNHYIFKITGETTEGFASSFMDSYFLGGDEVWCSISTKLQDYMM